MDLSDSNPFELTRALSIVIPAFNEEKRLPATLASYCSYLDSCNYDYEILIVDDGSTDNTSRVTEEIAHANPRLHLLQIAKNHGKGYAVMSGVFEARGELVLFCDADGSTPISELPRLLKQLPEHDLAIGSRAINSPETHIETLWYRKFLGRVFNTLVNILILPGIQDTQCGFKLFKREVAKDIFRRLTAERFSFDVELLFIARKLGYSIAEVPINWNNVPGSKVNLVWDSLRMLRDIFRFRLQHLLGQYK